MSKLNRKIRNGFLNVVIYVLIPCIFYIGMFPRSASATTVTGQEMTQQRAQDIATLKAGLEQQDTQARLKAMGIDASKVEQNLARLDSKDLHKAAVSLERHNQRHHHGFNRADDTLDWLWILLAVFLVLMVLYVAVYWYY